MTADEPEQFSRIASRAHSAVLLLRTSSNQKRKLREYRLETTASTNITIKIPPGNEAEGRGKSRVAIEG
jgi:hypothetical protein